MAVKKKQELVLDVEGMAFGGRGVSKIDGYTIFVDQGVAGDSVLARRVKKKKS